MRLFIYLSILFLVTVLSISFIWLSKIIYWNEITTPYVAHGFIMQIEQCEEAEGKIVRLYGFYDTESNDFSLKVICEN